MIEKLAEVCQKAGLKFDLYYSQDLDWHEPNGGGYLSITLHSLGPLGTIAETFRRRIKILVNVLPIKSCHKLKKL